MFGCDRAAYGADYIQVAAFLCDSECNVLLIVIDLSNGRFLTVQKSRSQVVVEQEEQLSAGEGALARFGKHHRFWNLGMS